jgi:mitotic-spindle organizing protein 1
MFIRHLSLKNNASITVLFDISQLLNTQLDRETLATCVNLIENGVNPEALAVCIFIVRDLVVQ